MLFAPFQAAGTLTAYFGGGFAGGILFAAAAVFSAVFAKKFPKAAVCSAGAAFGALAMLMYTAFYSTPVLSFSDKSVCAEVTVTQIVDSSGDTQQFIGTVNLGGFLTSVRLSGNSSVEVGDKAVVVIELEKADKENEIRNLAGGILLSGTVSEYLEIERQPFGLTAFIESFRGKMTERLSEEVFGDERELALSMFFGKDERLSSTLSERIKLSGVSHFTAVSGAHFAVFAAVLMQLFPSRNRRARAVFSFLITPCALVFFGATLSVLRSSLMFLIMSMAPLFRRKADTLNSLCVAVFIILTLMPQAILDIGFAMSVLGVFGAGVVGPSAAKKLCELLPDRAKFVSPIITAVFASLCAVVCTAPVSTAVFKGISLNAAAASILIMPLLTVGMTFMLLLGITGIGALAVPVQLSSSLIIAIVNLFGSGRKAFLNLDFFGAWVLAAICAVLTAAAAFGTSMKTFRKCAVGFGIVSLISVSITLLVNFNRCEIRFVGNSTTSAAVILCKNRADVFVSGSGVGIADDISQCLRERGAYKINSLTALDADFCGELAVEELSELVEINHIVLSKSISGISAIIADPKLSYSVNGIKIASASVSDSEAVADIILYHGSITRPPKTSAKLAVYFTNTDHPLPDNSVNIYRQRDFRVTLSSGRASIRIV